jgi:hypothetical protein
MDAPLMKLTHLPPPGALEYVHARRSDEPLALESESGDKLTVNSAFAARSGV